MYIFTNSQNFYAFKENSFEEVEYLNYNPNILMEVTYIDNDQLTVASKLNEINKSFVYTINQTSLGPFDYEDKLVKNYLNSVIDFRLNYSLKTYVPHFYSNNFECYLWDVVQLFSFAHRAHFILNLQIKRLNCEGIIL